MKSFNNSMKILDVGSGPRKYPGSVNIDINPENAPDMLHDLNKYPWPAQSDEFDLVHCSHCLEHLDDAVKAVEEMYRLCKPGGLIKIIVPHYTGHTSWGSPEHKRAFGAKWFNYFHDDFRAISRSGVRFEKISVKLAWAPVSLFVKYSFFVKLFLPIIKIFNFLISFLANMSIELCEKIWCYWVGGFCEILFELTVSKDKDSGVTSLKNKENKK